MSMWHRSSNPQPHPAVLPHLQCFETPDMAQSNGCPQEALGTGWDTAADCGLHLTHRTEDLAWLGTRKKKHMKHYRNSCQLKENWKLVCQDCNAEMIASCCLVDDYPLTINRRTNSCCWIQSTKKTPTDVKTECSTRSKQYRPVELGLLTVTCWVWPTVHWTAQYEQDYATTTNDHHRHHHHPHNYHYHHTITGAAAVRGPDRGCLRQGWSPAERCVRCALAWRGWEMATALTIQGGRAGFDGQRGCNTIDKRTMHHYRFIYFW